MTLNESSLNFLNHLQLVNRVSRKKNYTHTVSWWWNFAVIEFYTKNFFHTLRRKDSKTRKKRNKMKNRPNVWHIKVSEQNKINSRCLWKNTNFTAFFSVEKNSNFWGLLKATRVYSHEFFITQFNTRSPRQSTTTRSRNGINMKIGRDRREM